MTLRFLSHFSVHLTSDPGPSMRIWVCFPRSSTGASLRTNAAALISRCVDEMPSSYPSRHLRCFALSLSKASGPIFLGASSISANRALWSRMRGSIFEGALYLSPTTKISADVLREEGGFVASTLSKRRLKA